jgi:general secretion pathway protein I
MRDHRVNRLEGRTPVRCAFRATSAPAIARPRAAHRSRPDSMRKPPRGFSLLEVLVAFVILSLVAVALFRLFSAALNNASAADDYSRAVLVAESALATAAAAQPLREATQSGAVDDGRIEWATRVEPYSPPGGASPELAALTEAMPTRLYRVSAEVTFAGPTGGKRTYALATMRLGARDAR